MKYSYGNREIYRFTVTVKIHCRRNVLAVHGERKLNISIDVPTLINKAKQNSGQNFGTMAAEMHIFQTRISEWLKGKGSPSTDQIAYLAEKADLPIVETVAALRPEWAHVWKRAAEQVQKL